VRIERIGQIKEGDRPRGAELKAKVVKNRLGPAFTSAEMSLYFATGFSYEADLIALGLETGVVAKRGNWLHFGDVSLGNGSLVAARHLEQDADLAGRLRAAILERLPT
jgi:recombination protein RecA